MMPWTMRVMAEQRLNDLHARPPSPGPRYGADYGGQAARRARRAATRWQRLSEWVGYKMIGIGCRLARPAVVARVQASVQAEL